MKKWCAAFAFLLMFYFAEDARAFSYDDCIIEGMKGVGSREAALAIVGSCRRKQVEYARGKLQSLTRRYGNELDKRNYIVLPEFNFEDNSRRSVSIENKSENMTFRYIRTHVKYAYDSRVCQEEGSSYFAYDVRLRPGRAVRLRFPHMNATAMCVSVQMVRGRASEWMDISFSSAVNPLDDDPFDDPDINYLLRLDAGRSGPEDLTRFLLRLR